MARARPYGDRMTTANVTKLGSTGPAVFPLALGCMSMGAGSAYGRSDDAESIATIHAALDRGVNLLDTGDFYGMADERGPRHEERDPLGT